MTVNRKPTGTASSIPAGLAWGGVTALGVTLLGALVTAKLIDSGAMEWSQSGYGVMVILILASWLGALTAAGRVKRRRLMICMGTGAVYLLLLLAMTALFFGGRYSGVGETGLLILCGSLLGVFTQMKGKTGKKRKKTRF